MRAVAGFPQTPGNYYLKRGYAVPPETLVLKIWPWVDKALAMYERGGIEKVDLCGIEFLRLLKKLRVVFLQDAAILMKDYPDLEIWSHQVFKEPDWPAFAQLVRDAEAMVEEREDVRLREAVPVVAEKITTLQNSLGGLIVGSSARLEAELQEVKGMVKDLAAQISQKERGDMRRQVFVPIDEEEFARWHQPRDDVTNPVHHAASSFSRPLSGNSGPAGGTSSSSSGPSGEGPRSSLVNVSATSGSSSRPAGCPEGCPEDPLLPTMGSVDSVWREWHHGLMSRDGERRPSVIELEARFGKKWRYNAALKTRGSDRKKIILAIRDEAQRGGVQPETLVETLDKSWTEGNLTLTRSADKLKRELYKGKPLSTFL
ncbi:hypothetical protein V8E54_008531 [Elaphomyces granulatus]